MVVGISLKASSQEYNFFFHRISGFYSVLYDCDVLALYITYVVCIMDMLDRLQQ
jgi:hypothetical protein